MKYFLSTNCVSQLLVHFLFNDQELGQTLLQKVEPALSLQQESLRILVLGCACGVLVEREIDASLAGLIVHQQGSLIVIVKHTGLYHLHEAGLLLPLDVVEMEIFGVAQGIGLVFSSCEIFLQRVTGREHFHDVLEKVCGP